MDAEVEGLDIVMNGDDVGMPSVGDLLVIKAGSIGGNDGECLRALEVERVSGFPFGMRETGGDRATAGTGLGGE